MPATPICMTYRCNTCEELRPTKDYEFRGSGKRSDGPEVRRRPKCRVCRNAQRRLAVGVKEREAAKYRRIKETDPERWEYLWGRTADLRRKYGLTPEQYDAILAEQAGACAICHRDDVSLVVDHCHSSGRVRGILCNPCNLILGIFKDDPAALTRAINYLAASA